MMNKNSSLMLTNLYYYDLVTEDSKLNVKKIIKTHLKKNNISGQDLIVLQNDGLILKKKITENKFIKYRYSILRFISTVERNKFLIIKDDNEVVVKGIQDKPVDISFYDLFRNIDFSGPKSIIEGIENLRSVIYRSKKIDWFSRKDEQEMYMIPTKQGIIRLNSSSLDLIDPEDIDKSQMWENYIWPFCRSILLVY